jgi:hypothetical protein
MEGYLLFKKMKYAALLAQEIFISADIKYFDVLSYQIMPEHVHLLTCKRTLEKVRLGMGTSCFFTPERTFSNVRSRPKNIYTISDLMQSIKGNFSRKIHNGNIWQRRFYHRIVNTDEYLATVIDYIKNNPTKEHLPKKLQKTPYQYFDWAKINNLF